MKTILCIAAALALSVSVRAQFVNPDLNGTVVFAATIPSGWQNVPYTDPVCMASSQLSDTPDLTDLTGPDSLYGVIGNAYSGTTFVSGLMDDVNGEIYHEGIMQTLSNLVPGTQYTIRFHQAVVKQSNAIDQSGSWSVYVDNTLAGTTAPTFSAAPYNSVSFVWEMRLVTFTATSTQHTIKFLPTDDDANIQFSQIDTTGALRMGIDSIGIDGFSKQMSVAEGAGISFTVSPNPAAENVNISMSEQAHDLRVSLLDVTGTLVYVSEPAECYTFSVDISGLASGIYLLQLETNFGTGVTRIVKE